MAEIKTQTLDSYLRVIEISRDLASTLDLDILLDDIVRAAADITRAEAASILLYDDTARQLYFQVATNIDEPTMRGLIVPLDKSIAGWIVTNRRSARIDDAHKDERHFGEVEQTVGYSTRSLLGIPLITKNKVVGVLEVINKKKGKFTDPDESMLSVLGAQAAVAIENARLFQQSDLIAEFVHELRTPLASLSTATYLLLRPEMSREQRDQIV
ncbi:MAG TPA: GAF domain-containing protein, partial [Anaerolineales bacterium]|nr:GAF domain-containing protein [Anaerolineales bacterium]